VRRLDDALRATALHPALVPDAVKIATLKLLNEAGHGSSPDLQACTMASELLAYCALGDHRFCEERGISVAREVRARLEGALEADDSLDARLVLLTLHAGIIRDSLIEHYDLHAAIKAL